MENNTRDLSQFGQPQPPATVIYREPVPTTQLLHFTLIASVVSQALGIAMFLCATVGTLTQTDGSAAGCLFCAFLGGLGFWYYYHCLQTLRKLRAYAEWLNKR